MNERKELARIRELSSPLTPFDTGVNPVLKRLGGIKAVVFDIYGTLFISGSGDVGAHDEHTHEKAFLAALEATGFSCNESAGKLGAEKLLAEIRNKHESLIKSGVQYPEIEIREVVPDVLRKLAVDNIINCGLIDEKKIIAFIFEYEFRANPSWPMSGIEKCFNFIRKSGREMGIVSNAQFYTPVMIEAFLGKSYADCGFDEKICVWSYLIGEGKPSLRLYKILKEKLDENFGIKPTEALFVGNDMLKDIWAAKQCGFKTALFAGDKRSLRMRSQDKRCQRLEPDVIITDLLQLCEILQ